MEITICKLNNGIHPHLGLVISDPKGEDIEFIDKIISLVDDYNEKMVKQA